jgi:hypothetical protein
LRRRVVGAFAALFIAGCALVIDLGDRPSLRPADVEPVQDVGPVEVRPPERCGLERSSNEECAVCIEAHCCDLSIECSRDQACVAAFECIKDCMGQISCLTPCFAMSEIANRLAGCSAGNCDICSPRRECVGLGACGRALPDAGEPLVFRNVVRSTVLALDESSCKARLEQIKREGLSDAGPCQ